MNAAIVGSRELANFLGVSPSTERRKRMSGQSWPPHFSVGRKICYTSSSVAQWIAEQESNKGK
ncbi:hypothetical protein MAUB_47900 [Mycolicibacterium aubagnense]|uniref:Helix-turn-helix domain-containing protein n=1 Tax=Mycolicibacterium aubagnense TaxID=319707 RepID=A0ABM7IJG0_9MYCO|nr:hypothetical protein MAUB_47900 [Mycolicibacterium aubagnense]